MKYKVSWKLCIRWQSEVQKMSITRYCQVWNWWKTKFLCRIKSCIKFFSPMARQPLGGLGVLIFRGFAITVFRHTTLSRTPLNEWPARRRDLYLTTHNTHKWDIHATGGIRTHNPSKRADTLNSQQKLIFWCVIWQVTMYSWKLINCLNYEVNVKMYFLLNRDHTCSLLQIQNV
jgi:hypothetical protein